MLQSKKSMLIISISVALILWSYVVMVNNPIETVTVKAVPVELLNVETLAEQNLIMTNSGNLTIDVKIEGKKSEINRIKQGDIVAEADVYGYGEGTHVIDVNVIIPGNSAHINLEDAKIEVTIEELISIYKDIDVDVVGEVDAGLEIGAIKLQPEEVAIKGAKKNVKNVDSVLVQIPSEEINKNNVDGKYQAIAVDKDGKQVKGVYLSTSKIMVSGEMYSTKEVTLDLEVTGSLKSPYTLNKMTIPDKIKIKGNKDIISSISVVKGQSIDISNITATTEIPIKVELPEGVELARESKHLSMNIDIRGKARETINLSGSDVIIENVTSQQKAVVNTDVIQVIASGKYSIVNGLSKEDFVLKVSVEGLDVGRHKLPLKIESNLALDSIEIEPKEVYITISEE